jgi:hypothetical protein
MTFDQIIILSFIFGLPLLMFVRTWYVKQKINREMRIIDATFRQKRNAMIERLNSNVKRE